jgi:hypothetical protein
MIDIPQTNQGGFEEQNSLEKQKLGLEKEKVKLERQKLVVARRTATIAAIAATISVLGIVLGTSATMYLANNSTHVAKKTTEMQAFNLAASSPRPQSAYCNVSHWRAAGLISSELADPWLKLWESYQLDNPQVPKCPKQ